MDETTENTSQDHLIDLLNTKIKNSREKLLDLTGKNPLISARLGSRTGSSVRVVDELPDVIAFNLTNNQEMRFVPLPPLESDPKDEQSMEFQAALSQARLTDKEYLESQNRIDPDAEDSLDKNKSVERALKDRVRARLNMPSHSSSDDISVAQHAKNNDISTSYDLPSPQEEHEDGRHGDTDIQTLLLPHELDRKMSAIVSKCRTWMQETGVNVLQAAFGFLEWKKPNGQAGFMAPLVLASVNIDKVRTRDGFEFRVKGRGEQIETNLVLTEKLKQDFGLELPAFDGGSIEDYFQTVADVSPPSLNFSVRRQLVFGVFPSARMAMYHDLDTEQNKYDQSDVLKGLLVGSEHSEAEPFADEYEIDSPEIEQKVPNLVLDADSSQYRTLVDIADGKNVAVEGPPGTGKSQTIINAIATALSDGKKVLFVTQKMAALEVVRSRLNAIGLGEFVLPLQAERSTREEVIRSVRDRVNAQPSFNKVQEYETMFSKFRESRSELAAYIDVISQKFGNAGDTVHDILWKSVATQQALDSLPPDIKKTEIENADNFSHSDLSAISDRSEQLESAIRKSQSAKQYWRGLGIQNIDKFKVEEICETSKSASEAYTHAGSLLENLKGFGVEEAEDPGDLDHLAAALDELSKILPLELENAELVQGFLNEGALECLESFFAECESYQARKKQLDEKIQNPLDPGWDRKLQRLREIIDEFDFDPLDPHKFAQTMREESELLDNLQQVDRVIKPFIEAFPECAEIPITSLSKAKNLLAKFPNDLLALRNETTTAPASAIVIKKTYEIAQRLLEGKSRLEKMFSLRQKPDTDYLRKQYVILRRGSLFGMLSSDYRRAKKTYLELSLSTTFHRTTASVELENLCTWYDDFSAFCSDPDLDRVFGHHNKFIDTDFGLFNDLVAFLEAVDTVFPGIENLPIRRILKHADTELLNSLPEMEVDGWQGNSLKLQKDIANLAHRQERGTPAVKEVSEIFQLVCSEKGFHSHEIEDVRVSAETLRTDKNTLDSRNDVEGLLGVYFSGADTDPNVCKSHRQAARLVANVEQRWWPVLLELVASSERVSTCKHLIQNAIEAIDEANTRLEQLSQLPGIDKNRFSEGFSLHQTASELMGAAMDRDGLYVNSELSVARAKFQECGLPDPLVHFFVSDDRASNTNIKRAVEALIARSLAHRVVQEFRGRISRFNGEKLDTLRHRLAETDKKLIELSRDHIRYKVYSSANPPSGNGMGKKSTFTEMALIEHEINKGKRFVPVRDLTDRAGKALLELKPCWMMSPLAVAQYLPRGKIFDLCIIDEASQMPPEDAIGALSRCDQAVVVGDTNQLPPFNLFKSMIDDDDADEDDNVTEESVLELANSAFRPKRRLRWHYRSRHSGLIQFSNRHVYEDDLVLFPSANENRKNMGVSLVQVQGSYKSGTNGDEADAMIEAIVDFMRGNEDRSLGVVTLNQKQRDLLNERMDFVLRSDRVSAQYIDKWKEENDGLESFFIKNLENVQGDERDVIFIGTVYGPAEPGGQVMQRFGEVTKAAGKRRLNVLFSRAKKQIITFSSMTSADIRANQHGNPGAYMLKQWLEYSATGKLDAGDVTGREPDSPFEEFVIDQIRAMGCEPVPQVGVSGYFIDIGVRHPDWPHGFVLGVECDGATYHSSKSARDRDRLRQEVLEGLGWCLHRIWSTDWFNDPQKEGERLRLAISARVEKLKSEADDFESISDVVQSSSSYPETEDEDLSDLSDDKTDEPEIDIVAGASEVAIGDTVHMRYLSGSKNQRTLTLSQTKNDPQNGIVSIREPLGKALIGVEEGEEFEVLVGSYVRKAIVEKLVKGDTHPTEIPPDSKLRPLPLDAKPQSFKPEDKVFLADKLLPDQFYESDYQPVIRNLSSRFIESLGPITFKHLCEKVARAHRFQRTGRQIRKTVWAAVKKNYNPVKGLKGENIFWPKDTQPEARIPYRGLVVNDEKRTWEQVPYPEKLGLACSIMSRNNTRDPIETMARKIGLGRLAKKRKMELKELLEEATRIVQE